MLQQEDNIRNLTGKILLSTSLIADSYLNKSMVFVCNHDSKGAMGVVINKLIPNIKVSEIFKALNIRPKCKISDLEIHYGGPEEINRCFILHSLEYSVEGSQQISERLAFSMQQDVVRSAVSFASFSQKLLCMGCLLWEPDQLENEVASSEWLPVDADDALLFGAVHANKWGAAMLKIGIKNNVFSKLYGCA